MFGIPKVTRNPFGVDVSDIASKENYSKNRPTSSAGLSPFQDLPLSS
jgi:hypothetical protein